MLKTIQNQRRVVKAIDKVLVAQSKEINAKYELEQILASTPPADIALVRSQGYAALLDLALNAF